MAWTEYVTIDGKTCSITVEGVSEDFLTVDEDNKKVTVDSGAFSTMNATVTIKTFDEDGTEITANSANASNRYTLELGGNNKTVYEYGWATGLSGAGSDVATYQQTTKTHFTTSDDYYTITYSASTTTDVASTSPVTMATVSGVKAVPTTIDTTTGAITLTNSELNGKDVSLNITADATTAGKTFSLKLGDGITGPTAQDKVIGYESGSSGNVVVRQPMSAGYIKTNSQKITYTAATDATSATIVATLTGISGNLDSKISVSDNTITLDESIINKPHTTNEDPTATAVSVVGDGYTLAFTTTGGVETNNWTVSTTRATLTKNTTEKYELVTNAKSINYTQALSEELATVDGIKSDTNKSNFSVDANKVISIKKDALPTSGTVSTTTEGYTLAFDSDVDNQSVQETIPTFDYVDANNKSGGEKISVVYRLKDPTGYRLENNDTEIKYYDGKTGDILATITGLPTNIANLSSVITPSTAADGIVVFEIAESALPTSETVTISDEGYKLKLGDLTETNSGSPSWVIEDAETGTVVYRQATTVNYELSDDGKTITYTAGGFAGANKDYATLTGIKTTDENGDPLTSAALNALFTVVDAQEGPPAVTASITVNEGALDGQNITIAQGEDDNNKGYALKLGELTTATGNVTTATKWTFADVTGTPETVTGTFAETVTEAYKEEGGEIKHADKVTTTTKAIVTGLNPALKTAENVNELITVTEAVAADSGNGIAAVPAKITLKAGALTSSSVALGDIDNETTGDQKGDYKLALADDTKDPATNEWKVDASGDTATATYQSVRKSNYSAAADGESITYSATKSNVVADTSTILTISGLKKNELNEKTTDQLKEYFTVTAVTADDTTTPPTAAKTTVAVKESALPDTGKVSLTPAAGVTGYELALPSNLSSTKENTWIVVDGVATYKEVTTYKYKIVNGNIVASSNKVEKPLLQISGLNSSLNGKKGTTIDGLTLSEKEITVASSALTTGNVTITTYESDGTTPETDTTKLYTLKLATGIDAPTPQTKTFEYEDDKVLYKQPVSSGYTLASDGQTITYAAPTSSTVATISGTGLKTNISDFSTAFGVNEVTADNSTDPPTPAKTVITVKHAALNDTAESKVSIAGEGYELALADDTKADATNEWNATGTNKVAYQSVRKSKYSINANGEIVCSATATNVAADTKNIAVVSGVKTDVTFDDVFTVNDDEKTVTVQEAALDGKDVTITTYKTDGTTVETTADDMYTLALGTLTPDAAAWNFATESGSTTATYKTVTHYKLNETDGSNTKGQIVYSATGYDKDIKAIVTGLKSGITTADGNIVADDNAFTITLHKAALTGKNVALSDIDSTTEGNQPGSYKLVLDDDTKDTTAVTEWELDSENHTATWQSAIKSQYKAADDGLTVTYIRDKTSVEKTPSVMISGIKTSNFGSKTVGEDTVAITFDEVISRDDDNKKITVNAAALNGTDVTITTYKDDGITEETTDEDKYKLALTGLKANDDPTYAWSVADGVATYTRTDYYDYELVGDVIKHADSTAYTKTTDVAKITGLADTVTEANIGTYLTVDEADNTATPPTEATITIKKDALDTDTNKKVIFVANSNVGGYKFKLDDDAVTTVNEWSVSSTTAKYETVTKSNYTVNADGTEISYAATASDTGADHVLLTTLTGVNSALAGKSHTDIAKVLVVDGSNNILVKKDALATNNVEITIPTDGEEYTLTLDTIPPTAEETDAGSPKEGSLSTEVPEWTYDDTAGAVYQKVLKSNYSLNEDGNIVYSATAKAVEDATPKTIFSISGVNSNLQKTKTVDSETVVDEAATKAAIAAAIEIGTPDATGVSTITIKSAALGTEEIGLTVDTDAGEDEYKLALADDAQEPTITYGWTVDAEAGTASYNIIETVSFKADKNDDTKIAYGDGEYKTPKAIFTVSGIDSSITAEDLNKTYTAEEIADGEHAPITLEKGDNIVTVYADALTTGDVTIGTVVENANGENYSLALGDDIYSIKTVTDPDSGEETAVNPEWKVSGTTATYQIKVVSDYKLESGNKIAYNADTPYESDFVYATVTGLSSKLAGLVNSTNAATKIDISNAIEIDGNAITLHGVAITGSTNIKLTNGTAVADEDAPNYTLALGEDIVQTDAPQWNISGTTATYDQVTPPTYTYDNESSPTAIKITDGTGNTNKTTTLIKISNLNAAGLAAAKADDSLGTVLAVNDKAVTIDASVLGTAKTVTIEDKSEKNYTFTVDEGAYKDQTNDVGAWVINGNVAKYYATGSEAFNEEKTWGYSPVSDGTNGKYTITYTAPTIDSKAAPSFTISGIKSGLVPDGTGHIIGIDIDDTDENVVHVSKDLFTGKDITITGNYDADTPYKLAFDETEATEDNDATLHTTTVTDPVNTEVFPTPTVTNGTATVTQKVAKGYTLSADGKSIFYSGADDGSTVTLANITGLNKAAGTEVEVDHTTGVITLPATALDKAAVKLTKGFYTLALDGDVDKAVENASPEWSISGTKATYKFVTPMGYKLADDGKSISYAKNESARVLTTISGINGKLEDNIRAELEAEIASDESDFIATIPKKTYTVAGEDYATEAEEIMEAPTEDIIKTTYADELTAIASTVTGENPTDSTADLKVKIDAAQKEFIDAVLADAEDAWDEAIDAAVTEQVGEAFTVDTEPDADGNYTITLHKAALGTSNITVGKGYLLDIATGEEINIDPGDAEFLWSQSGNTVTLQSVIPAYYVLDKTNQNKITYYKATPDKDENNKAVPATVVLTGVATNIVNADGTTATGISFDPTTDDTITLSSKALAGKTVKITKSDDTYKLALNSTDMYDESSNPNGIKESEIVSKWETSGSKLLLKQGQSEGYALENNDTVLTYYTGESKTMKAAATITGISGIASTDAVVSVDDAENNPDAEVLVDTDKMRIVIKDTSVLGSSKATITGNYTFALDLDDSEPTKYWYIDAKKKTATLRMAVAAGDYVVDATGKSISKSTAAGTVDLISITGLRTIAGLETGVLADADGGDTAETKLGLKVEDGVVTLSKAALGSAKIVGKGSYKLALDADEIEAGTIQTTAEKGLDWFIKGTTAKYKTVTKAYYTLDTAKNTITYTAAKEIKGQEDDTLITIENLKSGASPNDLELSGTTGSYVVKVYGGALGTNEKKDATIKGATFQLDEDSVETNGTTKVGWNFNKTTATLEEQTPAHYTLGTGNTSIRYTKGSAVAKWVTITGLGKDLATTTLTGGVTMVDDNGDEITLAKGVKKTGGTIQLSDAVLTNNDDTPAKSVKISFGKAFDDDTGRATESMKGRFSLEMATEAAHNPIWYLDGTTAKWIDCYTGPHYEVDKTGTKFTYVDKVAPVAGAEPTITLTGFKKAGKTDSLDLTGKIDVAAGAEDGEKVITINQTLLDQKSAVTVANTDDNSYTLALTGTYGKAEEIAQTWTTKSGTATLKQKQPKGYTLSNSGEFLTYSASAGKEITLATVKGLSKTATPLEDSAFDKGETTVTLTAGDLTDKVTLDGMGYKFVINGEFSGEANSKGKMVMKSIVGGKNADDITVGGKDLTISTAAGNDNITLSSGGENVIINAGKGDDKINLTGASDAKVVYASGDGNDVITGASGNTIQVMLTAKDLEKAPITYTTDEDNNIVLNITKGTTVGKITLKETTSLSGVKIVDKAGDSVTVSEATAGANGYVAGGNDGIGELLYSSNYAAADDIGALTGGNDVNGFSVGEVETDNVTDLTKNATTVVAASTKK